MTEFGKLLKKVRIDCGELLYHMAKKLEVSSSFLSAVENGTKPVPLEWPQRIGKLYGLDEETIQKLSQAAEDTTKQVRIPLENASLEKRSLAMSFARRFDTMSQKEIDELLDYFTHNQERA